MASLTLNNFIKESKTPQSDLVQDLATLPRLVIDIGRCDGRGSSSILGSILNVMAAQENLSNLMKIKNASNLEIKVELESEDFEIENVPHDKCQEMFPNQTVSLVKTENNVLRDVTLDMWEIGNDEIDIKEDKLETNGTKSEELFPNHTRSIIKTENGLNFEMWKIKNEEVDIKEEEMEIDETSMSLTGIFNTRPQENVVRKCQNQHNRALEKINSKRHQCRQKNAEKPATMFKWDFRIIRRQHLISHCVQDNTKNTFNDDEGYLEKHPFRHRHPEKAAILKTNVCAKNPEVDMFRLNLCDNKALQKNILKQHLLRHRNPEEINMLKCDQCDYEALHKKYLRRHLLRHRNPEEINMFKCDQCDYEALHKKYLRRHLLRHRNPEEINMFKCDQCDYKALHKFDLKVHLLRHSNPEEINMFRCDQCDYKTLEKRYLKRHLLRHRKPEEINMFKCDQCDYKALHKYDLKMHLLRHSNPEEINMFKCNQCDYKTLQKRYLKRHLMRHRNPEVNMSKCDQCDYKTLQKINLMQHLMRHSNQGEINMFKFSDPCTYYPAS